MIVVEQNGFIGLCTGSLINPRAVIFAAHCVNERAAGAYGLTSVGQPIGFGSNNNVAGASAFGQWFSGYDTNTASSITDRFFCQRIHSMQPGQATGNMALTG